MKKSVIFIDYINLINKLVLGFVLLMTILFIISILIFGDNFSITELFYVLLFVIALTLVIYALIITNCSAPGTIKDLYKININENEIQFVSTNKESIIISKSKINEFNVTLDVTLDARQNSYGIYYYLNICVNKKLYYSFHSSSFFSIANFLQLLEYIPNLYVSRTSEDIPISVIDNMIAKKRGLNIVEIIYYILKSQNTPPLDKLRIYFALVALVVILSLVFIM